MIGHKQQGWIGVDIGSHTVKLAQLERTGRQIRLKEAFVIRRPSAWSDSLSTEVPLADSEDELRAGLALGQAFQGRDAAVTLSMSLCDVRSLQVPEAEPIERRELVAQELATLTGADQEDREFDYWPIDVEGGRAYSAENVLSASLSRAWSQQITRDLDGARLVGQVLDVLPTSLARALELAEPGVTRAPLAAIDWGYRRATFCVVWNRRPVFVRCFRDAGFAAMVEAVAAALSLTGEEAQKLLSDYGLPLGLPGENADLQAIIAEAVAEPLRNFAAELDRTLAFLRQQRASQMPEEVVLFGGGAATRNVAPFLADQTHVAIRPWELPGRPAPHGQTSPPAVLLGPAIAASALAWEAV